MEMLNNNTIDTEISQSEKLQCFLKKNGFYLIEDDHTVTLYHGNTMVKIFGFKTTAQAIYGVACEYQGNQRKKKGK
jgi:hypothetical protein